MPILASDALVLRTYQMGETSKVVVLLTRVHGKLRAVAKGARGRRPRYQSALEPWSEVRVSLYGRQGAELYRLGLCELIRSRFQLGSRSLEISLTLSYFSELIDAFAPEGETDDAVYRLAVAVLEAAESGVPCPLLQRYMEAWLLRLNGLYPPLDRCVDCEAALGEGERRYDARARGFVCRAFGPVSGPVLGAAQAEVLRETLRCKPTDLPGRLAGQTFGLDAFHQDLMTAHLERPLRSHRVLRAVARGIHE